MEFVAISSIETQVKTIKEIMFSENIDPYRFVSPSAYDTAWLAMIPDSHHQNMKPIFQDCLNWVLNNQKQQGFWGECDSHGMPSIECLIATLACIIALKKWDVGSEMIDKGMDFIHSNSEKFLSEIKDNCPRTLAIVLPAMFELSKKVGLKIELEEIAISDVLCHRKRILDTEQTVEDYHYPPLLSFLEALPSEYDIDEEDITKNLSSDGSLFHSPSATSFAFMATGNKHCLSYLQSLVQRCPNGVPTMYPMDEELIKLCVINHLHRLGLAEHFVPETERVLEQVYKNYNNQESWAKPSNLVSTQLWKDSLAFRLLRMHGYNVLPSISSIETQVKTIKEMMFSGNIDPYRFVSPSAYDTAWLAMIPDSHHQNMKPIFQDCLNWVLNNQKRQGFWGECDSHGMPSIECLIATLACIIALKKWDVGSEMIDKGMDFIHSNSEKFLSEIKDNCPRTLAIVLPAMFELSKKVGLKIELEEIAISDILCHRKRFLDTEQAVDDYHYPPLLSFLEALPSEYDIDEEDITKNLSSDGSLFHSPSATSFAFMATGNKHCLSYLQSLVQRCPNGVPTMYPMDEELIKLCVINHLHRLGLAEHFVPETERVLEQVYKNYNNQESWAKPSNLVSTQLWKDSLAFRLLRMHGYNVLPWSMYWFICDEKIKALVQNNLEFFCSVMLNIHRATDLMFSGEYELHESRSFSRNLLEKSILTGAADQNSFRKLIEHELSLPWMARLDHLDHRLWIEANNNALWKGKVFFQRLSSHYNEKLIHLAMQNYEFKQSVYKDELEELRRWSKDMGLSHMGFGREKTTYCYFAAAAGTSFSYDSDVRKMVAQSAIIITVADDFFDMKGSLSDLNCLTKAVQRWDDKRLSGHSKKIFNALDNIVQEMSMKYHKQHGSDITNKLRDIWYETFDSWMTESRWSRSEDIPSIDEYLQTRMISVAAHTIVLPASCFLNPSLPESKLRPFLYENITKLLMVIARLLNDMQSYQKEKSEGKINSILLCLENNPEADMEGTIEYVKEIVEKKKKEFVEQVLMDGFNDLPKPCKQLHLSCLKTFQMFFHSSNRFDSNTEIIEDINKAIYKPLSLPSQPTTKCCPNCHFGRPFLKYNYVRMTSAPRQLSWINNDSRNGFWNMAIYPRKFSFGFI